VIFDLDGVIVDTARFHFLAWRRLARDLGIAFTRADNQRLKGVSRMRSLDIILDLGDRTASPDQKREWADLKNTYYRGYIEELTPADVLPGVLALCDALETRGTKLAVASASKNAPEVLERIGLSGRFAVTVDGNDLTRSKPDPEIFLLAAQRLGLAPPRCAVVEDAPAGIAAARAAGMRAIGIGDPGALAGADVVVARPHQLTVERVLGERRPVSP
jgi:beta-phosphoglucomutase